MFKNYFNMAWRNVVRSRSFSSINLIGLSIGMTCCLIIFQYVAFESAFDNFHANKENLYRTLQGYARNGDKLEKGHAYTAQSLTPALKDGVPEVVEVTRVHSESATVSVATRPGEVFEEDGALYVDPSFLQMFSFPLVSGDAYTGLNSGNVLLSEAAALKYFGASKAEGQVLEVVGNIRKSYTVAGVFRNVPSNSHLQFDMLLPMNDLLQGSDYANEPEGGWSWNNFTTYVLIHPDAEQRVVESKMTDVLMTHRGEILKQQGATAALTLQPLHDIHLNSDISAAGNVVAGSYRTVYFFLVIGLITLVIALVNYINLATARALNRSREVGVRKAIGAKRKQLITQFLFESAFTNVAALLIALGLTSALLPVINDIAETQLSTDQWLQPNFLLALSTLLLSGILLAGLYPAFVLSSFRPALVLKGKTLASGKQFTLRKALVVVQFTACIVLISGTVIVYNQLSYMRSMDLGLTLDQVISVPSPRVLQNEKDREASMETFLAEIRRMPGVQRAAVSSALPGKGFNWNGAAMRKAADERSDYIRGVATYIDSAFAPLYGLKLVAGKEFSNVTNSDVGDTTSWRVIVNETAVKSLGFKTPDDAVNEPIVIGDYEARIIGVYKDFRWSSAHTEQQNIVFGHSTIGDQVSVRLATQDAAVVIDKIQSVYRAMFPGNLFRYNFVDETFDLQYQNDRRFARLFSIFAGMTIFIACLGLFGLVAFTAQQRTKEIGMRKVLGASVAGIVTLLSRDFLKLVMIGFVLAVPTTYYVMSQWLENFAYRTDIGVGVFILSGSLAVLIAMITVSWQSFKAAVANPVRSLRAE